ncbi:putative Tctex-1 family protein [Blattamonas nauphoetae]|uniref:Tctex-1 family protein n=1 Tax=Blattamonas nauphoetae TaxID=2049346 RepID=A0ABQ9YHB2_9EUKA|nr:putative Tctex-1 family protein [Blattamonas nauphoetae]
MKFDETLKSIFSTRPDEKSKDKLEEEKSSQKFDQWVELVVGDILKKLSTQKNQYKYAVTCHITQNVGAPFCSSTSTFWDIATDSYVCESFSTNEIVCNVTVFGFAL